MTDEQTENGQAAGGYPDEVRRVRAGGKDIILVGTAHVSRESVDLVKRVIAAERPDVVCVELDEKRYEALTRKDRWQALDLKEIIRRKQLGTLAVNLTLAAYQRKLGAKLGVRPGEELLAAAETAAAMGVPVELCDREVRVTMRRAWRAASLWKKGELLVTLAASLFDDTEMSEEQLARLKKKDMLAEIMDELGESLPELKRVVIDERDTFLAEKIKSAKGEKIVAVIGAGHLAGVERALGEDRSAMIDEINTIPPVSPAWKTLGWAVPALIIGSIVVIARNKGAAVAGDNILYWILANGIPSALGAALALAHPLTVLSAFAAAPVTSLTPVIGAGYVTAFVQVMLQPPVVREFETVLDDIGTVRGWWGNRLLKVLLAFLLPGFGSMIGTWVGGAEIISNLF